MKAGTIRAVMLGGLGACALAGGMALGNFTAQGITQIAPPMDEAAMLQAFARDEEARRDVERKRLEADAQAEAKLPPMLTPESGYHVCEGCDARPLRDPLLQNQLAAGGAGESDLAPDAYMQPQ